MLSNLVVARQYVSQARQCINSSHELWRAIEQTFDHAARLQARFSTHSLSSFVSRHLAILHVFKCISWCDWRWFCPRCRAEQIEALLWSHCRHASCHALDLHYFQVNLFLHSFCRSSINYTVAKIEVIVSCTTRQLDGARQEEVIDLYLDLQRLRSNLHNNSLNREYVGEPSYEHSEISSHLQWVGFWLSVSRLDKGNHQKRLTLVGRH